MPQTLPSKVVTLPIDDFARELAADLPRLMAEHPRGITLGVLQGEYGEPIVRVLKVTSRLQEWGIIDFHDPEGQPPYILPHLQKTQEELPYQDLTDLQRKLFELLVQTSHKGSLKVQTNYAQLSRVLNCSTGGARTSLERLSNLEYLEILTPSAQGRTNSLLLQIHAEKIAADQ